MRIHVATAGDLEHHGVARIRFEQLAERDAVGRHLIEEDPHRADAILFVDLQQHPEDPYLRILRTHPLVQRWPEKVYVYDERDLPFFTFPGAYVSATPSWARMAAVRGAPYPSWPRRSPASADRAPDLLFSFAGSRTHPVRDGLFRLQHERGVVREATVADEGYERLMARSKFVLCPRGHGPSSFRLYETLSAGRVPVVLSDDWLPPPRIDWPQCVVRIPESEVSETAAVLERRESNWPEMAAAVRATVREHLAEDRLWHHYATTLESLRGDRRRPRALWWAQSRVARIGVRRLKDRFTRSSTT